MNKRTSVSEESITATAEIVGGELAPQAELDGVSITLIRRAKGVEITVSGPSESALAEYYALCETFGGDAHTGYDAPRAAAKPSRSEQIAQHVARRYKTRR